ncbi:hypothetical protein QYF36_020253 [Acer negundo]|nr:hypothetical protein QYF36_020253 [Acer negundo]
MGFSNVNDFPSIDTTVLSSDNLKLRAKVEIENVAEDFSCWQCYGGNLFEKASSVEEPEAASVGWGNFPSN